MFDNIPENSSLNQFVSPKGSLDFVDPKDLTAIRTGLRQAFIRSKYRAEFLKLNRVETIQYKKCGGEMKRPTVRYRCVDCSGLFKQDEINVDHINKVGSFIDIMDIEKFFFRIFCSFSNLQILCKRCHTLKTRRERKLDALSKKYL